MQNWTMENNEQESLYINTDISELIPEDLIKDYKIDEIYLTTFSIDLDCLKEVLYGLNALFLVGEGKVQVFYDKFTRNLKQDHNQIISEKYLHGINLEKDGKLYAFHPKVILCKYINENNEVRYIMVILSKNISESNLLDTYAVAYGDVGVKITENGKKAASFWKEVFEKGGIENQSVLEQLEKVEFKQNEDSFEIQYFTEKEVFDKVKNKKDLIVISPFLSKEFFLKFLRIMDPLQKLYLQRMDMHSLRKKPLSRLLRKRNVSY